MNTNLNNDLVACMTDVKLNGKSQAKQVKEAEIKDQVFAYERKVFGVVINNRRNA